MHRSKEAKEAKGAKGGKGKKGDKGGKGKKGDKGGKGGQPAIGPAAVANAAAATEPGAVVSAATTTSRAPSPVGAAGLDSWANVYLKHNHSPEDAGWTELLSLADGTTAACKTSLGPKGIPEALVRRGPVRRSTCCQCIGWLSAGAK